MIEISLRVSDYVSDHIIISIHCRFQTSSENFVNNLIIRNWSILRFLTKEDARICFYINEKIDAKSWSIVFSSSNVSILTLNVKIDELDRKIDIFNVYNSSSSFYSVVDDSSSLLVMKQLIHRHRKIILLRDFNLHHLYWSESFRSTQHATIDRLLDIVKINDLQLTLSRDTITWKTRKSCSTINLVFMTERLVSRVKHCRIKSNMSQFSNHIFISTKLYLICERIILSKKRTWKMIDIKKVREKEKRASTSRLLNFVEKIDAFIEKIQSFLVRMIEMIVSWAKSSLKAKLFWISKCDRATKITRRLKRI